MKYTAIRFTYFCLIFFWISAGMSVAQEQQTSSAPTTAAIAGATIAEWKGDIRLSLPGQLPSNPLRGEQLPPGTILDTGSGRLLLRLSDGSEVIVRAHTRLQVQQPSLTDPSYFQLLLGRTPPPTNSALAVLCHSNSVPRVPLSQFVGPSSTWKSIH